MNQENVYVHLENHDFKHEIRLLLKAFYPNSQIVFVEKKALADDQSLLIEIILIKDENKAITRVSKNRIVLNSSESDIENIDIRVSDIKRIIKLGIKQSIVECMREINEIDLPWGVLTGIRPTKIVHELLDKNIKENEIRNILTDEYRLNVEKAGLITDVAIRERKYIYPVDDNRYSLYISIPFCPSRCLYCSFPSNDMKNSKELVNIYIDKLILELFEMSKLMNGKILDTVYMGGGTPTAIPLESLDKIIKSVYEYFGKDMREFTVEAGRPDTIDLDILNMLKENNIDRISINPQTMNDKTLETIGRDHDVKDIIRSYDLAKRLGFKTINMDLILGLPDEDIEDVRKTMEYLKELKPENLTVHTMAIKRTSNLKKDIAKYEFIKQIELEKMINLTKEYAKDMRLEPYYMYRQQEILGNFENVGYSKEGHECIYNMLIMEEKQTIIAVGAGGTSKVYSSKTGKVKRVPNVKNLMEYINRVEEMVEKKRSEVDADKRTERD